MLLLLFSVFIKNFIPEEFRELANQAYLNATIKVPKGLREETKYPGNYTIGNAHFELFKVLTSSRTTDLKGYAINNSYAAIVKRKKFNIADGFILIDIDKNEFYTMQEVVASDGKVSIYKIKPTDMFHVFSDIEINSKTPLATIKKGFNWDNNRNRPHLKQVGISHAGVGAFFSASAHAKARFKSIKKAEISVDVTLVAKIGAELQLKVGQNVKYPDLVLIDDIDFPIPGLSISFKFLGLPFDFGVYVTCGALLRDLETNLQVDIDYFKGYQLTAKRFICVKRHGISDSGWQTDFSPIPSGNVVNGVTLDIESNYIKATVQLKQAVKLKVSIFGVISSSLECGILEPFQIEFGFRPLACPFPYLYGRLEMPLKTYISFTGIIIKIKLFRKKIKIKLIRPFTKELQQFNLIRTGRHCLFDSKNNYGYAISNGFDDDDDDQFVNETSNRIISMDVNSLANLNQSHSMLSFQISLSEYNTSTSTQLQLFSRRASPFQDISTTNSTFDATIVEAWQNRLTSKISLNFLYYTGTNIVEKSNDYSFMLKEYLRRDECYLPVRIYNTKKTEGIYLNMRLNYCENLTLNEMYVPSLRNGAFESTFEFGEKFCVIVNDLDENSTDYVDENATFTTDGTLSTSLIERGVFTYNDEFFLIKFVNITLPSTPSFGTQIHYEIRAEWGNNFEYKSLLISQFSSTFTKGLNIINDDFKPKVHIISTMRLFVVISYIVNSNVIILEQPITYSEIQKCVNTESKSIIKTQKKNKISFSVAFERFKPIIKVNCSQPNSTHRIITSVYTLDSVKPSEYKPQRINFTESQMYGVFELKKMHPNVKCAIINMPKMQPLCNFTRLSEDYYKIPFDKDVIYIPFRRENMTNEELTIKHVIQGMFIDEESFYLINQNYNVDFTQTPVAIALVRTINNQYSVTNINGTKQTLVDYGNELFRLLALEYEKDQKIIVANSLIIIDDKHPLTEKTIPYFSNWESVVYHVWCERADEILVHDKTSGITVENNIEKDGSFFKLTVTPGHIIDFIPICIKNTSQSLCYFRQTFSDDYDYAIFKYPEKDGITILDTNLTDLFEQEDGQGLIEEVILANKPFYYMTSYAKSVQSNRYYKTKLDLELRVIKVHNKYLKFCIIDPDGFVVPVSRKYYSNNYNDFMDEYGIQTDDGQYLDFFAGNDSCIYATYTSSNYSEYNDIEYNETDQNETNNAGFNDSSMRILTDEDDDFEQYKINPSEKICDIAKSIKVLYYKDLTRLIPPANFSLNIYTTVKNFENDWVKDINILNYEIHEYFLRANQRIDGNNSNQTTYVLYLPYNEFVFNTTLNSNEYISANENITIRYVNGNLNFILPENHHTIIDLGDSNEINLSLYGNGTLEFKTTSQDTLKIKGNLNLNSVKTIRVSNNVKSIEFENIQVTNFTELYVVNEANASVKIRIINLALLEHSQANLTNIEISNTIVIKQTATVIFDNTVTVKNAKIYIDMIVYQNDLIPMIQGSLLEPPSMILIRRLAYDGPRDKDEYMIFDGQFDCQKFVDNLKFENSLFNTARCVNYDENNYKESRDANHKQSRAFVSFVKQPPIVKKHYYMDGGSITMIVFGIFDLIIIMICIILLLIRRRKNNTYNSKNSIFDHLTENEELKL